MKQTILVSVLVLAVLVTGCASQYKTVAQTQVTTTRTKAGEQTQTEEVPFISFQEVIEHSPNVKSVTRMTDLKGDREPGYFAISPATGDLIFQALEKSSDDLLINLWSLPTTGSTAMTRLTAGHYYDIEPALSRDGSTVCFSSNRSSQSPKLFTVRATGAGGITRLTQSEAEDRAPSLPGRGELVYYMSKPFNSEQWQVWRVNANGALPTQLKEGARPRVSPDGERVLFCAEDRKTGKQKIWMMNEDGTGETQLTADTESSELDPAWSPDGSQIVYASDIGKDSNGKRNFDIWMMNADGSAKTQLTTNGSTDLMPAFSPDGEYIYFLSNRGFHWDIWRMEIAE